jgi:hypothetical protein
MSQNVVNVGFDVDSNSNSEKLTSVQKNEMDMESIKRNKYTSIILLTKALITLPFYFIGLYEPFYVSEYSWILYMEAFHHFHARVFFLLAIYRGLLQMYFAFLSNGFYQKRFVILEVIFDCSIICLYLHENYALHNIRVFISKFLMFYILNALFSIYTVLLTSYIKIDHIV